MKQRIITLLLSLIALVGYAQAPYKAYAELLGYQKGLFSNKIKVRVDFGQDVSFWKQGDMMLVDENGKDIVFNSMVDAMNFMGKNGWSFVQAYVVTEGNQNVYHWLLSKEVTSEDQIKEGFQVKSDSKAMNQQNCITFIFVKRPVYRDSWDEVKRETKCDLSQDEITKIVDEWKSKSNDKTIYEVQIRKE